MKNIRSKTAGFIFRDNTSGNNEIDNLYDTPDQVNKLISIIKSVSISKIFVWDNHDNYDFIFDLIEKCRKENKEIKVLSDKLNILTDKLKIKPSMGVRFIDFTDKSSEFYIHLVKPFMDRVIAFISLILLSPIFTIISLWIKLTSKGQIFFNQNRIGYKGKIFKMYKFRTMYELDGEDEERKEMMLAFMKMSNCEGSTKVVNLKRITPIGRFLRRTSLDELPQLFNVLKGEMSLIGPRPDLIYVYENYEQWQKKRINVMPGCTGLWQVTGRSQVSFNDSMLLDLYYSYNISFLLDLKILLRTIPIIISSRGGA